MLTRLLFFAYGAACYLIFLATFLYAIAFVGGFAVPTRLDDGRQSSLATALTIDFKERDLVAETVRANRA